ncbi:MAG TPA: polysaccharide biosynthesis/export family protein [Thermoanaerobaculia bacterium]|nr:polysaccharide biosynthesis/export family protein [Thermoanaerobaculia bacterium]
MSCIDSAARWPSRLLALALLLAAGAATGAESNYRVGPRDLLEIQVVQIPEINVERRVSDEGKVDLPVVGEIEVEGLTEAQIRASLKTILESRYLQAGAATVSVQIKEFRSRPISVIGAVQKPGPLAFPGRWTLIEALTAAGGLATDHGDTIYVLRRADNGLSDQLAIRVEDLLVKGDGRVNVPIYANDLINVKAAVSITVFLVGEVKTAGAVTFKSNERITFLTALARAGGLTDRAAKKVVIRRRLEGGIEREIEVDARRILAGKDPDVELKEGDVIVVKESFF